LELARAGIALASPIVIWELASHVADASDPAYTHCLHAIVALGEHTRLAPGQGGGISIGLDSEWVVCDALFGRAPPGAESNVHTLGQLAIHVRDHAPAITDAAVLSNLKVFAAEMTRRETAWLADMQKTLDELNAPSSATGGPEHADKKARAALLDFLGTNAFEYLWAVVGVLHYATLANAPINTLSLQSGVDTLRKDFSVPFHLILALLRNLIGHTDLNLTSAKRKRGNFMWDAGIAYIIPVLTGSVPGAAVNVVTGDKAIVNAAQVAGASNVVVSLDDYLQSVGFT